MVAFELGYKDASHFSHAFKRLHGISLQEFLKQKGNTSCDFEI
jgi:AraC-like DNA-binding protein